MREVQRLARPQLPPDGVAVDLALELVGDEQEQNVAPRRRLSDGQDGEAVAARALCRLVLHTAHNHPHTAVVQVKGLGLPLIAVADDGHGLLR